MKPAPRGVLGETGLRDLLAGKPARVALIGGKEGVIILEDIGWSRIIAALEDAMREHGAAFSISKGAR